MKINILKLMFCTCSVAALLVFSLVAIAQEKAKLSYRFTKGQVLVYHNEMNMESKGQMDMSLMASNTERFTVEDIDKQGNISLSLRMLESKTRMKMPGQDTNIALEQLKNLVTRLLITPSGRVLTMTMTDTTGNQQADNSALNMSGTSSSIFRLPEKEVAIGEKWEISFSDTVRIEGNLIVTHTKIEGVIEKRENKNGHDCYKVNFTGTGETTGKISQMGMDMAMEGISDQKGSLWLDARLGYSVLEETTIQQDINMAITGDNAMSMPMNQTTKTVKKLVE